jgi:hypothetical protein
MTEREIFEAATQDLARIMWETLHAQSDAMSAVVRDLSDAQVACMREIMMAQTKEMGALVKEGLIAGVSLLADKVESLEREIIALREGRAIGDRLQ